MPEKKPIVPSILANRLALYTHFYTIHYSLRPFGASLLFIGYDEDTQTPELYMVEPSGMTRRYFGCAAGIYVDICIYSDMCVICI